RLGNTKLPDSFESLVSVIPVLTFFAVTSTPGINAPVASPTVPLRTALTWANAAFERATHSRTSDKLAIFFTVLSSPIIHLGFQRRNLSPFGRERHRDVFQSVHGFSCWLRVQRLSLELMADRRWIIRSYGASVAVLLLVAAIGSTLLHWHSDWNDQRCQLCHVRHLPSALGPVAEGPACPVLSERDWLADNPAYELESFFVRFSSRAPPWSNSFTVS